MADNKTVDLGLIDQLQSESGPTLISIYIPTAVSGSQTEQNRIRFKNQLKEVKKTVEESEQQLPDKNWKSLCALEYDDELWQHTGRGMAWFVSNDTFIQASLPNELGAHTVVGSRFFVRPLFQALAANQPYQVLTLSQNQVRLFKGNGYQLEAVELPPSIPASLSDASSVDEGDATHQYHSGGGAGNTPVYHDQQDDSQKKDRVKRYLSLVSDSLKETKTLEKTPLVLAGVEWETTLYKESAGSSQNIIGEIKGNLDAASVTELHSRSQTVMKSWLAKQREELITKIHESSPEIVARSIENVAAAALQGRVDTACYVPGEEVPGIFDKESLSVQRSDSMQDDSDPQTGNKLEQQQDLVELILRHTLNNGGRVIAVTSEELQQNEAEPMVALLRY